MESFTRFLLGTSLFLPAGDVGGEINYETPGRRLQYENALMCVLRV